MSDRTYGRFPVVQVVVSGGSFFPNLENTGADDFEDNDDFGHFAVGSDDIYSIESDESETYIETAIESGGILIQKDDSLFETIGET